MASPFIGEIRMFGGNFAPRYWALCNGQLLAIAQNTALFSLLGTMYGGDGMTTFGLPDLRGRVPLHFGQGAGLSSYWLGDKGGSESTTLTVNQLPAHNHSLNASSSLGYSDDPNASVIGSGSGSASYIHTTPPAPNITMAPASIGNTGGGQPVPTLPPYLAINFIICLQGIFPSRS